MPLKNSTLLHSRLFLCHLHTLAKKKSFYVQIIIFMCMCVYVYASISFIRVERTFDNIHYTSSVRILYHVDTYFSQLRYLAYEENGNRLLHIVSSKPLGVGHRAQIAGTLTSYELFSSSIMTYYRSLGIVARVKISDMVDAQCDSLCTAIHTFHLIKERYKKQFKNSVCKQEYIWMYSITYTPYPCSDVSGVIYSILFGQSSDLSQTFANQTKKIGIYHMFSFSGFQVALLFSWIDLLLVRILGRSKKNALLFYVLLVIPLICIVGLQPPVIRSIISSLFSTCVLVFLGRRLHSMRALWYSALCMIVINPLYTINISFLLSFAATFGLLLSAEINTVLVRKLSSMLKKILSSFIETLVIGLCTLPILWYMGSSPSFILVWVSNMLTSALISCITILAFLSGMPFLGDIVTPLLIFITHVVMNIVYILYQFTP